MQPLAAHVPPAHNRLAECGEAAAGALQQQEPGAQQGYLCCTLGGAEQECKRGKAVANAMWLRFNGWACRPPAFSRARASNRGITPAPTHLWVQAQQRAQAQEGVLLLNIVPNAAQRGAPAAV